MFLDANNCFYIDGQGIYVFYPEIGQVLFYEEKKDKILKFNTILLDENAHIVFYECSIMAKSFVEKMKAKCKANVDIYFYSQHNNELFKQFFMKERLDKNKEGNDIIGERGQIDYLLVIKSSRKFGHVSKKEQRILRIDWKNKIIKYYGDEDTFQINDFIAPQEFPLGNKYPINTFISEFGSKYPIYKEQLLLSGYGQSFDTSSNQEQLFRGLFEKFKKEKLIPSDFDMKQLEDFLGLLDSSIFKNNWYDNLESSNLMSDYINKISNEPDSANCVLKNLKENLNGESRLISDKESDKEYMTDKVLNVAFSINTSRDSVSSGYVEKKLEFNLQEALANRPDSLRKDKVARCGASNCYFILEKDDKKYGLRISSFIYSITDYQLYNYIIENIINSSCNYYCSLKNLKLSSNFPEISEILNFGFIKVKYTKSDDRTDKEYIGYIPYTISKHNSEQIQIREYIDNLGSKLEPLTECDIEKIIKNLLVQVYNFYVVIRPYFKFSHFDFKTDNILINPETMKINIIDFGNAQMNIYSKNRVYYLTNRNNFSPQTEYNSFIKNINNIFYSDNDIELLIWWLINNFKQDELDTPNKVNYYKFTSDILKLMDPISDALHIPRGNHETLLGTLLVNKDNFFGSLIIYRLYQIYTILKILQSQCKTAGDIKLIERGQEHFRKYVIGYEEDKFIKYQEILIPLIQSVQSHKGGYKARYKFRKHIINTVNKNTVNKNRNKYSKKQKKYTHKKLIKCNKKCY